jgi:hypothetical protein
MRSSIAIAAALMLTFSVFACRQPVHDPKDDLEATALALQHATSWHEEYDGPGGMRGDWLHRSSDRVCPHGLYMVIDEPQAESIPTHREYFHTAKKIYYREPGHWVGIGGTPVDECASGPNLDAVGIAMPLHDLLSGAHAISGDLRQVGSETCRDYRVQTSWREFVICINPDDHLPREVVSSAFRNEKGEFVNPERATYSKWNKLGEFDLPSDFPSG